MFKSYELLNKTSVNVNVKIFQKNITPYLCSSFNFIVTSTKSFLLILTFEMSLVLFVDCETLITRQGVPRGPVYNFLIEIIIYQKAFLPPPPPPPPEDLIGKHIVIIGKGNPIPKQNFQ